jgi:aspartyl-tRNA(Asn)/glutamyl-tRNA(Gln) amidotransferase subunit C
MTTPLTREDVRKVAHLARLNLTDGELDRFTGQLADVLAYVEQLNSIDTANVAPMAHAVELSNVFRTDEPRDSLPREAALANAPRTDGRYFLVPPILDNAP